jgi:hypothetical protein
MIPCIARLSFPVLPGGELGHGLQELVLISGEGCEIRDYLFPFFFAPEECVSGPKAGYVVAKDLSPLLNWTGGIICCNLQYVKTWYTTNPASFSSHLEINFVTWPG